MEIIAIFFMKCERKTMRVLIDTNVILDVLFAREPFLPDSIAVLHMCEEGFAEGLVTVKSLADIYYFLRRHLKSEAKARLALSRIADMLTVCDVSSGDFTEAMSMDNDDFEDALLAACARRMQCALVVTRNTRHFRGTGIRAVAPEDFVL